MRQRTVMYKVTDGFDWTEGENMRCRKFFVVLLMGLVVLTFMTGCSGDGTGMAEVAEQTEIKSVATVTCENGESFLVFEGLVSCVPKNSRHYILVSQNQFQPVTTFWLPIGSTPHLFRHQEIFFPIF